MERTVSGMGVQLESLQPFLFDLLGQEFQEVVGNFPVQPVRLPV